MGKIVIHIPQSIQIEYTLSQENLTHRILDTLNTLLLRKTQKRENKKNEWLGLFSDQPDLMDQVIEGTQHDRETDILRATS